MPVLSETELLRLYLDDQLPESGDATNAKFTPNEIETFLSVGGNPRAAAALGWQARAAELAKLVDQSEGPSKVYLSQKYNQALKMAESFGGAGTSSGTTKIRRISREGTD